MQGNDGLMYTTERYEAEISVEQYLEEYVDVEGFLEACKACPNYEKQWACPPYDFDVIGFWKKYSSLELTAIKIIFDEELTGRRLTDEEQKEILQGSMMKVKEELSQELYRKEEELPGSMSLSAGSCIICKNQCTRMEGMPCRFPEKMRHSIESLGGNVGLTCSRLMKIELMWMEEGKLPPYFVLVCGLLRP